MTKTFVRKTKIYGYFSWGDYDDDSCIAAFEGGYTLENLVPDEAQETITPRSQKMVTGRFEIIVKFTPDSLPVEKVSKRKNGAKK